MTRETSAILGLPYIQPAQAQKHVTHNEAIRHLDAIVQLAVAGPPAATPPDAAAEGARHVVGAGAVGDWAGQDGAVALRETGAWIFLRPRPGWQAVIEETGEALRFDGARWRSASRMGVNAEADATNRLSVRAAATLLSHEDDGDGGDHRLAVNKAGAADVAAMVLQSGFSGRAEIGLVGDDGLSVRVSQDGASWTTALRFDGATGLAAGAAVQQSRADATPGRLMRADWGYGPGNVVGPVAQGSGVPAGAVIERGDGADGSYTRWADGTQICWASRGSSAQQSLTWTFPRPFAIPPQVVATANLNAESVNAGRNRFVMVGATTETETMHGTFDLNGSRSTFGASLMAMGRWF